MPDIQWFPGHMARTGRELAESVRLADIVVEVLDARIPRSSANPGFDRIFAGRRRLIVLNKSDLADPARSGQWQKYYRGLGADAVFVNSKRGDGADKIISLLKTAGDEKIRAQAARGVLNRPVRAIIAGIPNSGKSSLINRLVSKPAAKTGDKPGVTKKRQWIRLGPGIELLDTPGVLWPKFEDAETALHLAFTGAIRDEVYDAADAAEKLLRSLRKDYMRLVVLRYGDIYDETRPDNGAGPYALLERTGMRRGFIMKGGVVDIDRTAAIVLDEFRAAKIGRITLETPKYTY